MTNLRLIFALLAGACLLGACGQSRPRSDGLSSELHFLRACRSDSCGKGLSCVCGVCTKTCAATTACTMLAKDAVCAAPADDACDEGRSCDVTCKAKADCAPLGDAYACNDGRCRAPAASKPDPNDPGLGYGPCTENPQCGKGTGVSSQSSGGSCICQILCDSTAECPKPGTGTAIPKCVVTDVSVNGYAGSCDLPCSQGERCPDGSICANDLCRFFDPSTCTGANCPDSGYSGTVYPLSCRLEDLIADFALPEPPTDCGKLAVGASSAERTAAFDCVRTALDRQAGFSLIWAEQGTDSELASGLLGQPQAGPIVVYRLNYDSVGTSPDGAMTHWSPCVTFSLSETCTGAMATCFRCEERTAQQCWCRDANASGESSSTGCRAAGSDPAAAIDPPPCDSDACEFDGVCYPDGFNTEDGCCSCDKGMGGCDEPAWCPGWVLIGKRCSKDADCSRQATAGSGLHCRTDFFGERGVCTRDCNFGCPTGTECVEVPDYNGGTIKNVCMRPCTAPADCAMESHSNALGSECDAPGGLASSYCF